MRQNPNLLRAVGLFESGWKASDIAKKLGVTKQAISGILREYYLNLSPPVMVDYNVRRVCKVCECEEYTTVSVQITSLKQLRIKPFEKTVSFLCPLCKQLRLHKCTSCKSVGYLEGENFLKKALNEENQRGRCLSCNRVNSKMWRKKNKNRARKIYGRYKKNLKQKRRKAGLCTECGKPNSTPEYALCKKCRDKYREKAKTNRQI